LKRKSSGNLWGYLIALGMVILVTVVGELVKNFSLFEPTNIDMLYILAVAISALYLGRGPSIMASFLSVIAFDFFFVPPISTFAVASAQYGINLLILWIVCIVISVLSPRMRA
jgi:two-component system sensor histidine kinase KdpD